MSCLKKIIPHPLFLTILIIALFAIGLGDRPYSVPSESRYIEIGREMAESGDFITPRLDYAKYFEKPALFYWVQALNTKFFGISPFISRIPTALFAASLCLLTYFLGNMLYGSLAGWLSAGVLATSLYMFALSRIVLLDVPESLFMVASLVFFLHSLIKNEKTIIFAYVSAALAVLTKGLIGIVLPAVVVFIWLALTNKWKILTKIRIVSGLALFLLIVLPWHILVALKNPEFNHFYFIHEHFERYFTPEAGRGKPIWFFTVTLLAGLFPYICFAPQAVANFWKERKTDGNKLFLIIWVLFILVFFSLSHSQLFPYILPIFPPIAVMIGKYLADAWENKQTRFFSVGVIFIIILLGAMSVLPSILSQTLDPASKVMLAIEQGKQQVSVLSIAALICAGGLLVAFIQGQKKHIIIVLLIIAATIAQLGDQVAANYNNDSTKEFADAIKQLHKDGDEVISYRSYYQDLPLYLARKVTVVEWDGTELAFGGEHEDTKNWLIDDKEFWQRWNKNDHLMFAVMRTDIYIELTKNKKPEDLHLFALKQSGRNLLCSNQLPEAPKTPKR